MPQNSDPGSAMLAHLRPLESTALQRCIVESSSGSQSSSSSSYSVAWLSGFISIFQSVSFTARRAFWPSRPRSEEHTSELQSRQYLVFRLLLDQTKPQKFSPMHVYF